MNKDYFLQSDGTYRAYGKELILDLHGCNVEKMSKENLEVLLKELCALTKMEPVKTVFWDEDVDCLLPKDKFELEHIKGFSVVQFISTSSIVVHTCEKLASVFVNLFTCKDFDEKVAEKFCVEFFGATKVKSTCLVRTSEGQLD